MSVFSSNSQPEVGSSEEIYSYNSQPEIYSHQEYQQIRQQSRFLKQFYLIALALCLYVLVGIKSISIQYNLAGFFITIAAFIPSYLWCSGRAKGMPIFPVYGISFIWAYALPIARNHTSLEKYSLNTQLFASITVTLFILLSTFIWFQFVKKTPALPIYYRTLPNRNSDNFFIVHFSDSCFIHCG
ncbi:MAG: hypothetical protein HC908_02825 [Calothrix sp. SM1_7_51]|nr:hypothetical protein [Calothrix sp. SM1_7_51]